MASRACDVGVCRAVGIDRDRLVSNRKLRAALALRTPRAVVAKGCAYIRLLFAIY